MLMLKVTAIAAIVPFLACGGCAGQDRTQRQSDNSKAPASAASSGKAAGTVPATRPKGRSIGPHIVIESVRPGKEVPQDLPYGVTRRDFGQIQQNVPTIRFIVPVREVCRQVKVEDATSQVQLLGTTPEYLKLHALQLTSGRFLTQQDIAESKQVAVVSEQVTRDLFLNPFPVGKSIQIDDHSLQIVGTIDLPNGISKASKPGGPLQVFVPVTTMRARFGDQEIVKVEGGTAVDRFELSRIEILAQGGSDILQTKAAIGRLLKRLHSDDSYRIQSALDD